MKCSVSSPLLEEKLVRVTGVLFHRSTVLNLLFEVSVLQRNHLEVL